MKSIDDDLRRESAENLARGRLGDGVELLQGDEDVQSWFNLRY